MQACAIEPEVRYFRTSKSDLSRVVRSRPLVKGNEDAGYEGGTKGNPWSDFLWR